MYACLAPLVTPRALGYDGREHVRQIPFSLAHTGLLEDAPEQRQGDVALMRVGDTQFQGVTLHKPVIAAAIGASETESDEASNQFAAFDRTKAWHQIGVPMSRVMPLIVGSGV